MACFGFSAVSGHALTTFDGKFLATDEGFQDVVGRRNSALQKLFILDVTHRNDGGANHSQLDHLRSSGKPFTILKRYIRADGGIVRVRNHVSLLQDGIGPSRIIASISVVEAVNATDERNQFALAVALLSDGIHRPSRGVAEGLTQAHWSIILSAYVLEQEGERALLDDICARANIRASDGYLYILELLGRKWIEFDYCGEGLSDSSAILTAAGRTFLTCYLEELIVDFRESIFP